MPVTLVLTIHPEPRSFTAAWAGASAAAAKALGHRVLRSDPYAEGFAPAEGPELYSDPPVPFDPLKAQETLSDATLPADVAREVDRLRQADRLIIHFPMWWFAPPAMLKGWCDRVLVHGLLHDTDTRFDSGRFQHLDVLFCVTTGGDAVESGPDGREGHWRLLLWPLAQTFRYMGARVKEPVALHGVHGYHKGPRKAELEARLAQTLDGQRALLAAWDDRPDWRFHADTDFDADGRLKAGIAAFDPFIRPRE